MKRRWLSVVSCLTVASLLLSGCNGKPEEVEEESALTVEVKTAKHKELVIKESYVGTASAQEEVTVYPTASGEVLQVNVKTGDAVTEGQQLFKLDDESARLSLKNAQAGLASQQASVQQQLGGSETLAEQQEQQNIDTLDRNATIAEKNISRSEREVENKKDDVESAKDDAEDAKEKYQTAKSLLEDWEDLQDEEDAFEGYSLSEAIMMTPDETNGPTSAHISDALDIISDAADENLTVANISNAGVDALKKTWEGQKDAVEAARRQVDSAKDSLQDAKRNATTQEIAEGNAIDNQELTDGQVLEDRKRALEAGLASTAVGVEQAQYALEQYTTKSPITGVVDAVNIDPHDTIGPSTAAMVISNKDSMKIEFSVTENVRDNLSVGQKVKVIKDGNKYKGAITEVGEMLDSSTGMFKIQAVVNGGDGLLNGTTVTVKVDSYRDDSGIVVPYDAVYYSNGEPYLYVAENGKAVRRDVETGMFDKKHIVIVSGLKEGEQVITSWAADLRDGAEIQIAGEETDSSSENSDSKSEETEKEGQSDEKIEEQSGDTDGQSDSKTEVTEEENETETNGQSDEKIEEQSNEEDADGSDDTTEKAGD